MNTSSIDRRLEMSSSGLAFKTGPSKPSADRTQPNTVTASQPKNAAFVATSAAPSALWFRRVATAATRYTPTGQNPHTKKRGVNARYAEAGPAKAAATSSSLGRLRASPNAATSTLSATAGQKSKRGQESTKSTTYRTAVVQRQQLAEDLVVGDVRRPTARCRLQALLV